MVVCGIGFQPVCLLWIYGAHRLEAYATGTIGKMPMPRKKRKATTLTGVCVVAFEMFAMRCAVQLPGFAFGDVPTLFRAFGLCITVELNMLHLDLGEVDRKALG